MNILFCLFGTEQTLVSLHGFREQSKCSKGFRSNREIEKHCLKPIMHGLRV